MRMLTAVIAVGVGALAFAYRFNTLSGPHAGFDNDHFIQLVRAEAFLDGELPLRDYADTELRSLWPPLTYATSAWAMSMGGRTLLTEAILTLALLSAGFAAVFWVSATISQSLAASTVTTLIAVALAPALYNYPKIFPYALAAMAMVAYAQVPTRFRLAVLAVIVAAAALYRHDHGVFLGLASLVMLTLVHGRHAGRPVVTFALVALVFVTPGLLFVQAHGGVITYLQECLRASSREAARTAGAGTLLRMPFEFDFSRPLLERVPITPPPPRIAVRWRAGLADAERVTAERELGLANGERRDDGGSWSYTADDSSSAGLERMVRDPRVADTDGIDRRNFVLLDDAPPRADRWSDRWRVAPGILTETNAGAWLRLVAWAVVIAALVCIATPPLRRLAADPRVPTPAVGAIAVLGVLLCAVFLRNPATYRLPDAAVPVAILGSWLIATVLRAARRGGRAAHLAVVAVIVVLTGLSLLSAGIVGSVIAQVGDTRATQGAGAAADRWQEIWTTLGGLPDSGRGIDLALSRAAAYVQRCTSTTDRLLVADLVPELYYFSRRGVAAGQSSFFGGFYTSAAWQERALARWTRQSVPIVFVPPAWRFENEFATDYPRLAEYLRTRYRRAGSLEVRDGLQLDVWVAATREGTVDPSTALPCFGAGDGDRTSM